MNAWLLESDMPDADGRILYLSVGVDGSDSCTTDPWMARKFTTKEDADRYRKWQFRGRMCPHCGQHVMDGRLLAYSPREHEWPGAKEAEA